MPLTRADAIDKFNTLHAKYYSSNGYMVTTVPDDVADRFIQAARDSTTELVWMERYNRYASDRTNILSMNIDVPLLGHAFKLRLDRPLVSEHRYEFESYFGFGGHCGGYTENRIILCFPEKKNDAVSADIDALLLMNGQPSDPVDAEYAKSLAMLLILSGYVTYWGAVAEFEKWFVDVAGLDADACKDTRDNLVDYIFNTVMPSITG